VADSIKDSFAEANRFTKVLYQRGKDVCPWELNEMQDVVRVSSYRAMNHGVTTSTMNPASNDDGWKVTGTGASNQVTVAVGWLFCDGIPLENGTSFTQTGFTTYGGVGSRTDVVYLAVTETEVSDPNFEPKLKETTRRRQVQVAVEISETGLAGVPSNTSAEIFEGGTHYFPIASIDRPTGQAAINAGDVTDLRYVLPAKLLTQITRQEDFEVQALVATVIETPGTNGNPLPVANTLTLDIDPGEDFVEAGELVVRFNRDGLPRQPFVVRETNGLIGEHIGSEHRLAFRDENVAASGPTSGQYTIPFSSGDGTVGDSYLRLMDVTHPNNSTMLMVMNARNTIVVGDGSTSFGDFNGVAAIYEALQFAATLSGSVCIQVKRGNYTVTDATVLEVSSGQEIVIDGMAGGGWSGDEVVVTNQRSAGSSPAIYVTDGRAILRHLKLVTSGTAKVGVQTSSTGAVIVERCSTVNQGVVVGGTPAIGYAMIMTQCVVAMNGREAFLIEYGNGTTTYGFIVTETTVTMTGTDNPVLTVKAKTGIATATALLGIFFSCCNFTLGSTAASAAAFSGLTNNCGMVKLDPNGSNGLLTVGNLMFHDCCVTAPGGSGSSILLYLRTQTGASAKIIVDTVSITGGRWRCASANTNVIPFYVGGQTSTGTANIDMLIVKDVSWGFGPDLGGTPTANRYGAAPTELGTTTWPSAFYIHVDDQVVLDNIHWLLCSTASDIGDLTVYQPRRINVNGLNFADWISGGGGSSPAYRVHLQGWRAGTASITDFRGSMGGITRLAFKGIAAAAVSANGGIIDVLPNGRLSLSELDISDFTTGTQHAVRMLAPTTTFTWDNDGLLITNSQFRNMSGSGFYYRHPGTVNVQGSNRLTITDTSFYLLGTRGIDMEMSAGGSGGTNHSFTRNWFESNTGLAVYYAAPTTGLTLVQNYFSGNNGGGVTATQIQIGVSGVSGPSIGAFHANTCAATTNRLQFLAPSSFVGTEIGYAYAGGSGTITNANKVYTTLNTMLHNLGTLLTP
jgi:hypothetical protein